jgi:hypothetical protein
MRSIARLVALFCMNIVAYTIRIMFTDAVTRMLNANVWCRCRRDPSRTPGKKTCLDMLYLIYHTLERMDDPSVQYPFGIDGHCHVDDMHRSQVVALIARRWRGDFSPERICPGDGTSDGQSMTLSRNRGGKLFRSKCLLLSFCQVRRPYPVGK